MKNCPNIQEFITLFSKRGYGLRVGDKPLCLNIVGWRDSVPTQLVYNDWIAVYWREKHTWAMRAYRATTLPGGFYLKNPLRAKGTAILVPGQYRYQIGKHRGKDPALTQAAPVKVYRDNNKDSAWDMNNDTIESGYFGINVHRGYSLSQFINRDSAGCQVIKSKKDFEEFIGLCGMSAQYYGNNFIYTLVEI